MTHSDGGKGDDVRPTDHKKFSEGYDLIWGKKVPKEVAEELNQQLQDALNDTPQHVTK